LLLAPHGHIATAQTLFTVDQSSGRQLIADGSFLGSYFAFMVTNVASPAGYAYMSVGNFVGGKITLAPTQPTVLSAGYLAPGSSKMVYAYFNATDSNPSTNNTDFSVKVWTFRPSAHSDIGFAAEAAMSVYVKKSIRCESVGSSMADGCAPEGRARVGFPMGLARRESFCGSCHNLDVISPHFCALSCYTHAASPSTR
jgi:hypothetical protein